ncbi:MAG: SMP-30/gluconolactonase/LRE family protein [Steroidobacteraceae bacterium]
MQPFQVISIGAQLGEGPVWVAQDDALWFVDVAGCRLHRYQPDRAGHDVWAAPGKISFILPLRDGGLVAGLQSGLHRFDPRSGSFTRFAAPEADLAENRLNDACAGPAGDLWFGSMHDAMSKPSGVLYRLDRAGRITALDRGYVVTNGPAFSPDAGTFYHTDSSRRLVYAFDHANGSLSNKRVFIEIEEGAGFPDGTTVDAQGCLWIALWGGWAVRRYSARGELLDTVRFPCAKVTKIAFGGQDNCMVYATTAWEGLSAAEREAQPLAGDLFGFRAPVAGLPPVTLDLPAVP